MYRIIKSSNWPFSNNSGVSAIIARSYKTYDEAAMHLRNVPAGVHMYLRIEKVS